MSAWKRLVLRPSTLSSIALIASDTRRPGRPLPPRRREARPRRRPLRCRRKLRLLESRSLGSCLRPSTLPGAYAIQNIELSQYCIAECRGLPAQASPRRQSGGRAWSGSRRPISRLRVSREHPETSRRLHFRDNSSRPRLLEKPEFRCRGSAARDFPDCVRLGCHERESSQLAEPSRYRRRSP
jgi:hypothetical protein